MTHRNYTVVYGDTSAPSTRQIAEAVVAHGGVCSEVLHTCSPYINGRSGGHCPFYSASFFDHFCCADNGTKLAGFRKWLMEER